MGIFQCEGGITTRQSFPEWNFLYLRHFSGQVQRKSKNLKKGH